jgi:hypothetical protein
MRWSEEVELLIEEMRRVRDFLEWEVKLWERKGKEFNSMDTALIESYRAYAQQQATLRRLLAEKCRLLWGATVAFAERVDDEAGEDEDHGLPTTESEREQEDIGHDT